MKSGVPPARLSSGRELVHRHSAVCLADMLSAAVGQRVSNPLGEQAEGPMFRSLTQWLAGPNVICWNCNEGFRFRRLRPVRDRRTAYR
jgi:hypothetical protein